MAVSLPDPFTKSCSLKTIRCSFCDNSHLMKRQVLLPAPKEIIDKEADSMNFRQ